MHYFDAHTHAHFAAFEKDWKEVIDRALAAGVWLVNVGTQKDTSKRAVEIAHEYKDGVYAAIGLHPIHTERSYHDEQEIGAPTSTSTNGLIFSNSRELENKGMEGFTSRGEEFDYEYYKKLSEDPKVVAIGECGLDYYRMEQSANREAQVEKQKKAFIEQIKLAIEVRKTLMIHCREAFLDIISIISAWRFALGDLPRIIHFFTGTTDDAKKLLDLGFSFTFGGVITFARDYDEVIKLIPLGRILSETDAPYVSPVPYRGKRNEPAYVIEVVKKLAELKGVSVEEMKNQIFNNAKTIFKL